MAVIEEAAARLDLPTAIIEKDFWVCWTLRRLVETPAIAPHLTFKGGTSLSKAYGIIRRFSEDIDLTIGRTAPFVKDTQSPMEAGVGSGQVKARTTALTAAATRFVAEVILPELSTAIAAALGTEDGWKLDLDDNEPMTVLFEYPRLATYDRFEGGAMFNASPLGTFAFNQAPRVVPGYVRPVIKLEFGARGDTVPSEIRTVRSYVAEQFPDLFTVPDVQVSTLAVERTFWEKATILHALYHNRKIRGRLSRHYADLHMAVLAGVADVALGQPELLAAVVRNKELLFRDASASYGTAVYGTFRFLPQAEDLAVLKQDYDAMQEMFMGEAPSFDEIVATLTELERQVNALAVVDEA